MTETDDLKHVAELLRAPFALSDLEWRWADYRKAKQANQDNKQAIALPYVQSRAIMSRLDKVVGPHRWKTQYREVFNAKTKQTRQYADKVDGWEATDRMLEGGTAVECTLSIKFGDEWVSKADVGEVTQIAAAKGGYSDALKRAAVQWGLGRDLYQIGAVWAGWAYGKPNVADCDRHMEDKERWYMEKYRRAVQRFRQADGNGQPVDDSPVRADRKPISANPRNSFTARQR